MRNDLRSSMEKAFIHLMLEVRGLERKEFRDRVDSYKMSIFIFPCTINLDYLMIKHIIDMPSIFKQWPREFLF